MSAEHFLDSNVFVYLFDDDIEADKRGPAEELVYCSLDGGTGCISYQVAQETLNVLTGKAGAPSSVIRVLLDDVLIPLWQFNPTPSLYRRGLELQARYDFGFYDSLNVAASVPASVAASVPASIETECSRLYIEDMQYGQRVQDVIIQSPFVDQL